MSIETWVCLAFLGYPHHFISSLGRVKSTFHKKEGVYLTPWRSLPGYYTVYLARGKPFQVHRLVAYAFLGLDFGDRKLFVCHKNDNKIDNRSENLFLGSHTDNMRDCVSKGRSIRLKKRKLTLTDIETILLSHRSQTELGKMFGVSQTVISYIKLGRTYKDVIGFLISQGFSQQSLQRENS